MSITEFVRRCQAILPAGPAGGAAYLLIAEPSAGKATAGRTEAGRPEATYVTARNFRTFDDKPEWHGVMLFLEGLDESRG